MMIIIMIMIIIVAIIMIIIIIVVVVVVVVVVVIIIIIVIVIINFVVTDACVMATGGALSLQGGHYLVGSPADVTDPPLLTHLLAHPPDHL